MNWRRALILTALATLLVVLALPLLLLTTAPGARWMLGVVESTLPLTVRGIEGSAVRGLQLQSLAYGEDGLRVEAESLRLRADLRCLLDRRICLREVRAARLDIALPPAGEGGSDDPLAFLSALPRIDLNSLALERLSVTLADDRQEVSGLAAAGRLGASGIRLTTLRGCHALACVDGSATLERSGDWEAAVAVVAAEVPLAERGLTLPREYRVSAAGDLASLRVTLGAPKEATLKANGELSFAPGEAMTAAVTLDGLAAVVPALEDEPWLNLAGPLRLRARVEEGGLVLDLTQLLAGYGERPLPLAVELVETSGHWRLERATLGNPATPQLSAEGRLGPVDALAPELALSFSRYRPPERSGISVAELSGQATVSADLDEPLSSWRLESPGLVVRERERVWQASGRLAASDDPLLPVGTLEVALRGAGLMQEDALPIEYRRETAGSIAHLDAPRGIHTEGLSLTGIEAEIDPVPTVSVRLRSTGDVTTQLALAISESSEGVAAILKPFTLDYGGERFDSLAAVDLAWLRRENAFETGPLCIQWQNSRGCSDGLRFAESGDVTLELSVDEAHEGEFRGSPFTIAARGSGYLGASWREGAFSNARLDLDFDELSIDPLAEERTAPPVRWEKVRVAGAFDGQSADVEAELDSGQVGRIAVSLGKVGDALTGRLSGAGLSLSALTDLLPEWSIDAGLIDADLRLAGTAKAPEIFGSLLLQDAGLRIDALDTDLENVFVEANFEGRAAALTGEGILGGGALRMEGRCCEDDRLTGILIGDRNRLTLPLGLDASLSPSLDISLDAQLLEVTGSLTVHDGVFEHSGLGDDGIAVSDDVQRLDQPAPPPSRFGVRLDINTLIQPGFTLRSKQIESTLGGDLRFTMPASAPPSLFGSLTVLGGELRAYGTVLRLTQGSLGFVGDPLNPDLSLSAEREIRSDNQRVGFRVRGTLDEPELELFSDPQRPDNETISYLLRGRPPDVGVSADGTAMALSLGATALNQSGVLAPLNAIPGLSGVSLGAEGTAEDMAATISAYVGNRLYLSYGVGIYEPINALTARLYLRSRLWMEVVSRLENSFDLYYRFDLN